MRKICKVTLNQQAFHANCGDVLLDSAIMNGIDFPHDCRSGICGACRVRLVDGKVFGGTEEGSDMIHACQARIVSDLKLATEPVPDTMSMPTRIAAVTRLAHDVTGVSLELPRPLEHLAGQYCKLQFRRFADGAVSSAIGERIRVGHRVRLTGPFGSAFFRPDHPGRIVLVASGTGFAPMWSIATTAIVEQPRRELVFVVAARKLHSFYMHAALCRLALFPNVVIIPVVSEPQQLSVAIRTGRPTDFLPPLKPDDVVYTSGAPMMTDEVARIAREAGVLCYSDPFVPHAREAERPGLMDRWFGVRGGARRDEELLRVA